VSLVPSSNYHPDIPKVSERAENCLQGMLLAAWQSWELTAGPGSPVGLVSDVHDVDGARLHAICDHMETLPEVADSSYAYWNLFSGT
jgi:hypothetical protein